MEKKEKRDCEGRIIDDSIFRIYHTIDKSLITAEQFDAWRNSPITRSLLKILEYYCITPAIEFKDNGDIGIHLIGAFDIKKAILEREYNKRRNEE